MPHLLVLVILVATVAVAKSNFLTDNCLTNENYTANSTYRANLNTLQSSLLSSITPSGFYNTTVGQDPNQVFGLALCRGDVSDESCQSCIRTAINESSSRCPYGKSETIWYDDCLLRYSNADFFGSVGSAYVYYMWNSENVTDPEQFNTILGQLMSTLASKAAHDSNEMFAAGFVNHTSFTKLYGMAQCTRDLSKDDCYRCLEDFIGRIPSCCDGKIGGRVLGASCYIRYESSVFYNTSAVENAAAPATTEPTNEENSSKSTNAARIAILVVIPVVAASMIFIAIYVYLRCVRKRKPLTNKPYNSEVKNIERSEDSLLFDLSTIKAATNNFSEENKLGQGGFGPVYKGILTNGQEIAVKRLARNSQQGLQHLRNEVMLVAKLQHKNLVRLLGYCLDELEKLLLYEYLSNTSLDKFLFDPLRRCALDWERRLKIIEGIARGLVYLHEDSRLKIIHRDLKASNILLDADMNPKISDFGLAKLFDLDATHANTSRIAGTYGYMAPEYAMHGLFSTKSDVFSFGILVLEILTGRSNSHHEEPMDEYLLTYIWRCWNQGVPLEAIDRSVPGHCPSQELVRCIHIGLLCVQDDPLERPNMASVILMLSSRSMTLPAPSAPPFVFDSATATATASQSYTTERRYDEDMHENVERVLLTSEFSELDAR